MSSPGIQPAATRPTRATWVKSEISASPAPGYWTLTATARPSFQTARCTCPIEAAAAGVSSNSREPAPPLRPELGGEHLVHRRRRHRRSGVLELGQRRPVRAGELLGQGGLEDAQGLAELHRAALELAEHLEQLLGGAGLHLGGDELGRPAADPLAEPDRRAAGEAEREGRQLRRAGHGTAGRSRHGSIVAVAAGPRARPPGTARVAAASTRRRAVRAAGPAAAAPGCAGHGRRETSPSGQLDLEGRPAAAPAWPRRRGGASTCSAASDAAEQRPTRSPRRTGAGRRPSSWARTPGHAGSRSARCRSRQRRHGPSPGQTSGPTTTSRSRTTTDRCGTSPAQRGRSRGALSARRPTSTTRSARRRAGLAAARRRPGSAARRASARRLR